MTIALLAFAMIATAAPAEAPPPPPVSNPAAGKLTGIGYAPISSQLAATDEQRRLLAIRASQLAAIRNLAEQIHGVRLRGATTVTAAVTRADMIRASVEGVVPGARIVKITPKGTDVYETVVELDGPPPVQP